MKRVLFAALSIAGLAYAAPSFAFNGSISFSSAEVRAHENALPTIMSVASNCLESDLNRHNSYIRKYGVSAFYGENSSFAKSSTASKQEQLRRKGLPASFLREMAPTSCIGLALKCLKRGFEAGGQGAVWARIRAFTRANDVTGNSLQHALRGLGWRTVYWNPDTSKARAWDAAEQRAYPGNPKGIWGRHAGTLASVMNSRSYGGVRVDDVSSAVNFGGGSPSVFKRAPFFVGIAHQGYHVFPGTYGQIIEGHSTRAITDPNAIETSRFSPLTKGGGPRGGPYKSGLVAVPPGY